MANLYLIQKQGQTDREEVRVHPMTTESGGKLNLDLIPDYEADGKLHLVTLSLSKQEAVELMAILAQRIYTMEMRNG